MAALACPVCLTRIEEPAAYALHVAACTTLQDGASTASTTPTNADASCPMCHMVYTNVMAAHEIEFHEEECERVNGPPEPIAVDTGADGTASGGGGSGSNGRPTKRARDTTASDKAVATSAPKLYPAHCAVCESGGRTLLHCAGKCARSFHPMCIEEINAREYTATGVLTDASSTATSFVPSGTGALFAIAITRDRKAQREWVCGECSRGLHTCQLCGFLGHESHELVQCKLPDCGFFFHAACLEQQNHRVQSPLVCPRHTCTRCRAIESDLATCWSCAKCCKGMHIRCREAAAGGSGNTTPIKSRIDVLDPNFYVCEDHKSHESVPVDRKLGQYAALRMKVRPGDVVLILEYGNLLLPSTAKDAAPDAFNQWGVVQRVENLGNGTSSAWWTQLVTVTLFSDNSSIDVPNRYVLPVSSLRAHSSPTQMIRDMVKWHALCELHLRYRERDSTVDTVVAEAPAVLSSSEKAFKARADALGITPAAMEKHAMGGLQEWKAFVSESTTPTFLATTVPLSVALDTRGRKKADTTMDVEAEASTREDSSAHEKPGNGNGGDDDVDMDGGDEDASTESSPAGGGKTVDGPNGQSAAGIEPSVLDVMSALVQKIEASCTSLRDPLHDFVDDEVTASRVEQVVFDMVETIAYESMSVEDVTGTDEDMAMEAPEEEGQQHELDEHQAMEQRMSIDDLLNPLSQDDVFSIEATPSSSSLPATSSAPSDMKDECNVDEAQVAKKRKLDEDSHGIVNVLDVLDKTVDVPPPLTKKPKIAVKFQHLPLELKKPRGSVFSRAPLPVPSPLSRKQKALAAMPELLMRELDAQVNALFEAELDGTLPYKMPAFRPAFYRPTPFLYRGPRIDRRNDAISRALLCQDKRNLRCFVRHASSSSSSSSRNCPHKNNDTNDAVSFVCLDLMGIPSFAMLEVVIRDQLAELLQASDAASDTATTPRDVRLSYCLYDGSEHTLPTRRAADKAPEWLCFCANVVHLTATIM